MLTGSLPKALGYFALAMVLAFSLTACGGGGSTAGGPTGGGADIMDPYLIRTAPDLKDLADRVNSGHEPAGLYYKLVGDIDLSAYSSRSGGKDWTPIGRSDSAFNFPFTGHFDGNGKTVSNLSIDDIGFNYAGLFGYIDGGTVRNLEIAGANVVGNAYVGGIAGALVGGAEIVACSVTGNISGDDKVGGVAGYVNDSSISSSYAASYVSGGGNIGGVAGEVINNGGVSNSYATGDVAGENNYVGGVAGSVAGLGGVINSYATGEVSGGNYVGGVAGYLGAGEVSGCAALNPAIERVSGSIGGDFGRVLGLNNSGVAQGDNAAFEDMLVLGAIVSGPASDENGADISGDDAKLEISYTAGLNWAFGVNPTDPLIPVAANPWKWGVANYPLPVLSWQTPTQMPASLPGHLE